MIRIFSPLLLGLATAAPAAAQSGEAQTAEAEAVDRQAFIAQMDAEFSRLDVDGNGMVVPDEIVASQRRAAQAEALRQNQTVFAQLDADGSGTLDAQEFAALASAAAIPVDPAPLLAQFDTDRDQVITLVEYRVATQANFDRVDSDRNGVATAAEMRAAGIVR